MQKLAWNKVFIIALLVISVIGFSDASYLTAKHYLDDPVTCSVFKGCETVTTSKYSTVFNIPIALFGVFYYLFMSILLILYLEGVTGTLKIFALSATAGFVITLGLIYIQAFVLNAFCMYCLISAASSTALFFGSLYLMKLNRGLV